MLPALKQATSTIPVVMAGSADPVGQGLVQSLGHPGANITGLSLQGVEVTGKRLELLKQLVPAAAPVAVLWERPSLPHWQAAARRPGHRVASRDVPSIPCVRSLP
jgi:putative ABC transport system substrate-binding protein